MRFLHVSDLHIGKRLARLSLMEDQQDILDQIVHLAAEADCVLVAGDVFNRAQPGQDALQLAGRFFEQLAALRKPVAVIAGNHDNAELIGYCAGVLRAGGIYAAGGYEGELQKITLSDAYGEVDVWLMPFLRPANVRPRHPEAEISSYADAIGCVLANAPIDRTRRNVLVAHQYVAGAVVSESEELIIGGLDQIPASLFEGFDYVALGHLHAQQSVGGSWIRYSGAPLCYAVDEAKGSGKCALMVDMDARGDVQVEKRPLKPLRAVRQVKGLFQELLAAPYSEDLVSVVLTDIERPMDAVGALRVNFPNLVSLVWESYAETQADADIPDSVEDMSPLAHIGQFYRQQNGGREMSDAQRELVEDMFRELIEKRGDAL